MLYRNIILMIPIFWAIALLISDFRIPLHKIHFKWCYPGFLVILLAFNMIHLISWSAQIHLKKEFWDGNDLHAVTVHEHTKAVVYSISFCCFCCIAMIFKSNYSLCVEKCCYYFFTLYIYIYAVYLQCLEISTVNV